MWLSTVPGWLSALFMAAILVPVVLIALLFRKGASSKQQLVFYGVIAFFAAYFSYVYILCANKLFESQTLPPKILQLTTMPFMALLILILFFTPFYKNINRNTSTASYVRIHVFRFVGGFLLILSLLDQLPLIFGVIAGIGDIVTAITSIFVARIIEQKKPKAKTIALIWNTFGLLDILATSTMAFVFTKLAIETGAMGVEALTKFPFCLIPAFAPPVIIFLHLSLYRKLLVTSFKE